MLSLKLWLTSAAVLVLIAVSNAVDSDLIQTGTGSIVFEEAWTTPSLIGQSQSTTPPVGQTIQELQSNLLDIHNQRLQLMNENDIDFMVLSCASPCIQGISDPEAAAAMAVNVNNVLASSISNNTRRFGAFAALSMHNASIAMQELTRAVNELGFVGALVNDYQQSGSDNATLIYYDQPAFDPFWQLVTDLDVPVYFHPRSPISQIVTLEWAHSKFLIGPAQEFAVTLSTHIVGLCANGVFDRFPKLKIIVGHLGERIPSDLLRIDQQLARQKVAGMPMLRNVSDYWRTNLFETTSGNFFTDLVNFHSQQIGMDRILFSIDYPYVNIPDGTNWLKGLKLPQSEKIALARGRAIELLGLNKKR